MEWLGETKYSDMFMNTVLCSYSVHLLLLVKKVKHMCLNKVVIFVFFAQKSILIAYPHSFIASLLHFWALNVQFPCYLLRVRKLLDLIKKILICVLKMNEGFTGLAEWQNFHFWVNLPFKCDLAV